MAKKLEINENWEPVEVEDLDNLFIVVFKHGSFDQGYVEAFDTDDILMQSAYDNLAGQYEDCGCDELTKIYLIKVPNTEQTVDMCNTGLFNGNCCDPHVIEATRDLFNRADCEQLSCWEGCGLTEAKKKKKPYSSAYCGFTDPALNIKHFNKCMGTSGLQNPDSQPLVVGDTLPNAPVASDSAGESAGTDGGAMGESLSEDVEKELKIQNNENIEKDIEELNPPIEPEYFPNNMGINLSSVKSEKWVEQDDGQLKEIKIEFDPATEEEKAEDGIEENLTEAHLDYSTQLAKMKALENRTRGFNAASASDEKLEYNWKLCKSEGLSYAQSVMEQEMLRRGGRLADLVNKSKKKSIKISSYNYMLDPGYFNTAAARVVWTNKDDAQKLLKDYGHSIEDLLIILVFALLMKQATLAGEIKDYIINNFTVTLTELKDFLNSGFGNKALVAAINQVIRQVCTESLEEDAGYSHKLEDKFELPPQINLLDQNKVEDFIKQLSPEELFRIGYATPLYFYSELDDKFDLVKATEMEGYTGLDYRDASVNAADHDERVANAQRQINTYADVLDKNQGHKLNTSGERFSTTYRATNKLALNPEKSNEYIEYELDDDGNPKVDDKGEKVIKSKIDMNKILFYPRVGSQPITHYYVDFHNGQGFKPIKREVLVDTLYKFIMEVEKANAQGVSKTDLMWLQKKGYGNIRKDANAAIQAFYDANGKDYPIWAHRKAEEANMSVEEYAKEHPFSGRWSMSDFRKKATSLFDADAATIMAQDASTVGGKELAATTGMDRTVSHAEAKPQVRALYSNQVYYLDGKPGTFGRMLKEDLEEDVELAEAKDPKTLANLFISCLKRYYNKHGEIKDITDFANYLSSKFRIVKDLKKELSSDDFKNIILDLADKIKDNDCYDYIISNIDKILAELKGLSRWDKDYSKKLDEAKRYVKRYYVRPQNIFCSNKEDILQALLRVGDENCSIYSLKNLPDHNDVHLLKPSDIIYYYDDHVLYDKNHVQVMDYDLFVKHEEDRKKVANVDAMSDAAFADEYDDRITDDDLKDKDVIANFKAINAGEFKEELELTEGTDFNGFFTFDDNQEEIDFNAKWAKNLNGENERIPGVAGSEVQVWIKQDNNRYAKRPGYFKFVKMFLNTKGVPYIKIAKLGQEDQELSYKFMAFFKPQSFNNNPDKLYYLTASGTLKSRLEIYLEDKKNIKAQKRTAAYQGARSVQSLSEDEQKLALDWFSENIVSIDIKYPTGTPTYTQEEGALDSKNPIVKKCAEKFARLDAKFHKDFGVDKNTTEGYLDTAKKVHFSARDASEIQEKTVEYYNRWGLSCLITFKETLGNANDIVLGLIAQAKKDSIEAKNDVNEFKLEDRSVDSIFLCYAIKELVDDDWNKLSEIAAPDGGENPFNQDFAEPTDESLKENKEEEKCCICGEPINGYGNNPAPYKDEGRCCDACNLKFVIPARLAAIGNKEEE